MRSILKLTGLNNLKIAIDSRAVYAIAEFNAEFDENTQKYISSHVALFTDKNIFRVSDSYDSILEQIEEVNEKEDLGI